jgi:hypothetical protein
MIYSEAVLFTKALVGKPEGKRTLGRPRHNIQVNLK